MTCSASLQSARPEIDSQTLALAKAGDERAAERLFGHYQERVFAFLWRMLGRATHRALAEDLLQETFLQVFKALPRFDPGGPAKLSTWIFKIAYRQALNELRRIRRREDFAEVNADGLAGGACTDEVVLQSEVGRILFRELERLSKEHRAIFLLREYDELAYEEIGEVLDLTPGTVKSRLARAREALRKALEAIHVH